MFKFSKRNGRFNSVAIDHRGHGASHNPSFTGPHNMPSYATDLLNLFSNAQNMIRPNLMISHSFGGKVALKYIELISQKNQFYEFLPQDCWILDTIPGSKIDETFMNEACFIFVKTFLR